MRSTKSPNLELIVERKIKDYFSFSRDVPFEVYLIRINNMMGMIKNMIGNKLYSRRILFVRCFNMTVRSTTIITDYVGMIGVLSSKVDLL